MCTLFAATHPDRCLALVTLGAYARRNWAPDYPIGRRAEQDGWLRPTRRAVGHVRRAPVPGRARAVDRRRRGGDRVVRVVPRARGEPVGRRRDHRHERGDRRPPRARRRCGCRRSSCTATRSTCARPASYMGERLPGARVVGVPGTDHLPWEGDQESVLAAIETFFGELGQTAVEPGLILTTVLEADVPESEPRAARTRRSRASAGASSRRPTGRVRASFDGPARAVRCASALAGRRPVAARRRPHRRVRAARRRRLDRRRARDRGRRRRRGRAGPDPRHLDRARPRRRLGDGVRRARHGHARGHGAPTTGASSPSSRTPKGDSPLKVVRFSSTSRGCGRWCRSGGGRRRRRRRGRGAEARTSSQWSALGQPASSQRPSGDHSRSASLPGAAQDGLALDADLGLVAGVDGEREPVAGRRERGGEQRGAGREAGRVALAGREVVDRVRRGGRRSAAGGRRRTTRGCGRARPPNVHSTLAVSASSTVTVPSVGGPGERAGSLGRQAGATCAIRSPACTSCSPLP